MNRYLPIVLGVLLIVGLTVPQFIMTDRLSGTNVTAEQQAELLKKVPENIGDWHGENMEIDEAVRKQAGAVGAISRVYRNVRTGQAVDLWLIVGHARAVANHTPDVCYPSSGFETRASENSVYPLAVTNQPEATFLTNTFYKEDSSGRRIVRVFWSWYNAGDDEEPTTVEWQGPANPRLVFGNSRALYKMYFTGVMPDQMETAEQSACLRFARDFMPVVNKALAAVNTDEPVTENATKANTTKAQSPTTEATPAAAATPAAEAKNDEELMKQIESANEEPAVPAVETESLDNIFGGETKDEKKE